MQGRTKGARLASLTNAWATLSENVFDSLNSTWKQCVTARQTREGSRRFRASHLDGTKLLRGVHRMEQDPIATDLLGGGWADGNKHLWRQVL